MQTKSELWILAAAVAGAVALLYTFVWPRPKSQHPAWWTCVILRWAHAAVWWLLALAGLVNAGVVNAAGWVPATLGGSAFVFYMLFLIVLFLDRTQARRQSSGGMT